MINGKTALGLIPARGGSKGLPGKNVMEICNKPLIAWTIEKAKKSAFLDMVLVSTDDPQISAIAKDYGADVPFLRPAELATDTATTLAVVEHALAYMKSSQNREFFYTVLLEPTSPLREDDDIDNMLEKLDLNKDLFDALISVGEVSEHPSFMKRLVGERIDRFCNELQLTGRRQDNEPAYFPYGVGYVVKTASLLREKTFYTSRCSYYQVKRYQNYEIDDLYDFLCVQNVMKHEWGLL
jgi:CMP-N,N'-diacetyllegionaminic acid synthase